MDCFDKENIVISQDDISTPLKKRRSVQSGSPLRDRSRSVMFDQSLRIASTKESYILPDEDPDSDNELMIKDFHALERQLANLLVQNSSLNLENQNLEMDLLLKEKELLLKSSKINELVISNRMLEKNYQSELTTNEANFNSWSQMKLQYEKRIANLNNILNNSKNKSPDPNGNDKDQITIQILNKKLKSLQSDYELEKNSKLLIIDEFEMIKQNYLNLELNYSLLKNEFDRLQEEISSGSIHPEPERAQEVQDCSFQSDSSYGDVDVEHIYSNSESKQPQFLEEPSSPIPRTPITLANEFENDSKYLYNQELIKLNFQIKSLNLQNEKLYSYIGYLLQNSLTNSKEYSDEKLIKLAKRKLVNNKILRSVSSSLRLHQSNRTEHPQQLTVYPDHATDEEMSIFLNDYYETENKKIYNIKSTANLKKLHFTNSSSSSYATHTLQESLEEEDFHDPDFKLSILKDLVIGNKIIMKRLNLHKLLVSGVVEFLEPTSTNSEVSSSLEIDVD